MNYLRYRPILSTTVPDPTVHTAADDCVCPQIVAEKFGGEDLGIVEHKQIVRIEVLKDVLEHAVLDLVAALVQHHQARLVTHGTGMRGNQFLGHLGVEF